MNKYVGMEVKMPTEITKPAWMSLVYHKKQVVVALLSEHLYGGVHYEC